MVVGVIAPQGPAHVARLASAVANPGSGRPVPVRERWFPNRRFGLDFGGAPHDSPTRVKVQSWGDRVDHSIDWVDLDGGFTDMMTRLRMLAVYRNRLVLLPPSN